MRQSVLVAFILLAGALAGCTDEPAPDDRLREHTGKWTLSTVAGELPFRVTLENLDHAEFASLNVRHVMDWDDGTIERADGVPQFLSHTYTASGVKALAFTVKDAHGNVLAKRTAKVTALPSGAVQTYQANLVASGTLLECGSVFRPELLNVTYLEGPVDARTHGAKFVAHFEGESPAVNYAVFFYKDEDGHAIMFGGGPGRVVGYVPFDATFLRIFACGGPVGFTAHYEASYVGA